MYFQQLLIFIRWFPFLRWLADYLEKKLIFRQFFLSFVAGGIAFVFDFGVLIGCVELFAVNYLWGNAWGFLIGSVVNYFLTIWFVFDERKLSSAQSEFSLFLLLGAIGLVLQQILMWVGVAVFNWWYVGVKILVTLIVFLWNFYARKWWLFR